MSVLSSYEEKKLLLRIAEGDDTAFSALFYHYLSLLKPFLSRYTKSNSDVMEVLQETFVCIWLNRYKLPEIENPAGYIFRIAANQYHLLLRKKMAEERRRENYHSTVHEATDTTSEGLRLRQLQQLVNEAVNKMPSRRKTIFLMSRRDGMTFREIAHQLKISHKTVKNTVFAALNDIRAYLTAAGESIGCSLLFLLWL